MITMSFQTAKQGFFDQSKVKDAVDAGMRRVLSRFGAFVRTRARTSIRKRKGTSPPGSPPYSHVGLLRQFILFAYDPQRKSVVIGPTLIRSGSEAPSILEYGGTTTRERSLAGGRRKKVRAVYRPRPYMRPAFKAEQARLPDLWKNSVR